MSEQDIYLATRQDILQLSNKLTSGIVHYMALIRIIVLFIASLPLNIVFFVLTHLFVLLVSVLQDVALLASRCYLDFQREARGTTL